MLLSFVSCETDSTEQAVFYTVKFETGGGSRVKEMKVLSGELIPVPEEPTKEGYVFDGWRDSKGKWLFAQYRVRGDMTLTAVWVDAKSMFEWESRDGEVTIKRYKGSLVDVTVPDIIAGYPVTTIADGAFEGALPEATSIITLGKNVVSVGARAFANCADVQISVGGKLEYVGEQAFLGCNGLKSVSFGSGAKSIPYEAFKNCSSLELVTLSDTVSDIAENAFEGCTSLARLVAHSSLASVGDGAFADCTSISAVLYYGEPDDWDKTDIAKGNDGNLSLEQAKLYIYSETAPEGESDVEYWHYDDNGRIRVW